MTTHQNKEGLEILPCPFCGSPAEIERDSDHHGGWFNLGCSRHWGKNLADQCVAGRLWYTESEKTEEEAIAAWNRRAPDTASQAREKIYREALEKITKDRTHTAFGLVPTDGAHIAKETLSQSQEQSK